MLTEARGALLVGAALTGCASGPSMTDDLRRVRHLSAAPALELSLPDEGGGETSPKARALLAAPLTADSAVELALLGNRELRATLRGLGVPRGQLVQAGLMPNPEVEVDLRRSTNGEQPMQADFFVAFDLTHALLTAARQSVAAAELDAARIDAAAAVVGLGVRTRVAFYALQAAEERFRLAQQVLDALAAGRDAARALLEAGNVTELDVAVQEVAYESTRASVAELELDVVERREVLHILLGLHGPDTTWRTAGGLPAVPAQLEVPPEVERRAIVASLSLQHTRARLEAIAGRTGLARAEGLLPDITVDAHAEQDGDAWEVGGGASITLPVFDRNQGTLGAYEAEFDALHERYVGQAIAIRSAARRAQQRLLSAHARAKLYAEVIAPARARVLEHTLLQYNAMQVGVFQLLEARRQQLEAELSQVVARREFYTARAAMEALLAGFVVEGEPSAASGAVSGSAATGGH